MFSGDILDKNEMERIYFLYNIYKKKKDENFNLYLLLL